MSRRERKLLRRQGKKYKPEENNNAENTELKEAPKKQQANKFYKVYEKIYRKGIWATLSLLIISLIIIAAYTAINGEFIPRGVSLKGGVTITATYDKTIDVEELQTYLRFEFPQASISVREMSSAGKSIGFIVDASDVESEQIQDKIQKKLGKIEKMSVETMGSALGDAFFKQTIFAMIIAFTLMAIVVFISFRLLVPSFAVVLCGFSDIIMTIAAINVFGIKIETAGIAALLMLVGYSVDTDVLLTTRVLKRTDGTFAERIYGALKTGMTMTITSIVAVMVGFFITQSETLKQIMLILLIGLFFDIINTWIQNVAILEKYVNYTSKKKAKETLAGYSDREKEETEYVDADFEDQESEDKNKDTDKNKDADQDNDEDTDQDTDEDADGDYKDNKENKPKKTYHENHAVSHHHDNLHPHEHSHQQGSTQHAPIKTHEHQKTEEHRQK